jgi:hypothetical protein
MKVPEIAAMLLLLPLAAHAQTTDAPRVLSEAEEIELAKSAAPPNVSHDATILVLRDGRYRKAVEGAGQVTCMVSRSQPLSLEPICYDAEASRTVLRIEILRVESRLAGVPIDESERRIESMIESGELPVPDRPAMAYMMSADQVLYADADTHVGQWYPHIHIFIPYATADQFGGFSAEMAPAVGTVVNEGEPTANLMIRVREFVQPAGDGS